MAKTAKTFWKRFVVSVTVLALAAGTAGFVFFKVAQHKIASRLKSSLLQRESKSSPDLAYRTLGGAVRHVSASRGKVVPDRLLIGTHELLGPGEDQADQFPSLNHDRGLAHRARFEGLCGPGGRRP